MNSYKYLLLLIVLVNLSFAEGEITNALLSLCGVFFSILPIGLLLLVVLAAVTYAIGQILGAETRARATVWSTSMLTGAIVAALIFILIPSILENLGISEIAKAKTDCLAGTSSGGSGDGGSPSICAPGFTYVSGQCIIISKGCNPACKGTEQCVGSTCIPKLVQPGGTTYDTEDACKKICKGSCIPLKTSKYKCV